MVHRRYVPYSHAHYAGNLVDGAYSLGLFGDVATEMCILTDGDEGLFASYSDVQFKQPVRAGDVLEIVCEITRVGTRSRTMDFTVHVVARGAATEENARCRGDARRADPGDVGDRSGRRAPVEQSVKPRVLTGLNQGRRVGAPTRRSGEISDELLVKRRPRLTCGFPRRRRSSPG